MTRFSALALVLLAASTAHAAEKKFDKTFTVAPGGSLVVEADGASVKVSGTDSNQVTVHMVFKGPEKELADVSLDATQNGNDVNATMRRSKTERSWFNWGRGAVSHTSEVTVPKRTRSAHRRRRIDLNDTTGSVRLNTSGGDISARNQRRWPATGRRIRADRQG
jgi:hypothetical protein